MLFEDKYLALKLPLILGRVLKKFSSGDISSILDSGLPVSGVPFQKVKISMAHQLPIHKHANRHGRTSGFSIIAQCPHYPT